MDHTYTVPMAPSTVQRNTAGEVDCVQMELKYELLMSDLIQNTTALF